MCSLKATVMKSKADDVWTIDDDTALNHTTPPELTVWSRVEECWGIAAPLTLPLGLSIEVTRTKSITTTDGRELQNTNWPSKICQHLGNLVHCPSFIKDLPFFQYALQQVHDLRISSTSENKAVSSTVFFHGFVDGIVAIVAKSVSGRKQSNCGILKALEMSKPDLLEFVSKESSRQSIHYRLLDYVDVDTKDLRKGIVMADLICLEKAWAKYAGIRGIDESSALLNEMEVIKKKSSSKGKKPAESGGPEGKKETRREIMLARKKAFIMKQRLERPGDMEACSGISASASKSDTINQTSSASASKSDETNQTSSAYNVVASSDCSISRTQRNAQPVQDIISLVSDTENQDDSMLTVGPLKSSEGGSSLLPNKEFMEHGHLEDQNPDQNLSPGQLASSAANKASQVEVTLVANDLQDLLRTTTYSWWVKRMGLEKKRQVFKKGLRDQMTRTEMLPGADGEELENVKKLTFELLSRCREYDSRMERQRRQDDSSITSPNPKRSKLTDSSTDAGDQIGALEE